MKYTLMFFTLLLGCMLPFQAIINARLGRLTGGALMASLISFGVGLIFLTVINLLANPGAFVQLKLAQITPWYLWLGGIIGAFYVAYITWVNQQQGVALTFALIVSGQIFFSLLIDHFGLLGSTVRLITLEKWIGAGLIIAGIILIKK